MKKAPALTGTGAKGGALQLPQHWRSLENAKPYE